MENSHQLALRRWIHAGLAIEEVRALDGDAGYILNNMIAKYSLYADSYRVSPNATAVLEQLGIDLSQPVRRGAIYGKKKPTVFEHAVPAKVVRAALLASTRSVVAVKRILARCGPVAILTREEDTRLSARGLSQKMPATWVWGDGLLARYDEAGIDLSKRLISMYGAVKR